MWRRLRHPEPPPKSFGYEFDSKDAKEGRAEAFPVYLQILASWRLERSGRELHRAIRRGAHAKTRRRKERKWEQKLFLIVFNSLRLGVLSEAGVSFIGRCDVGLTQRRGDAKEGRAEAFPVCLEIFASWRLERSGRELHGESSIPLAIRLMPSFIRSAPKLRRRPSRMSASLR